MVNPAFIDLESRGGLGWLDGFNGCWCAAATSGRVTWVDDDGRLKSLHGRVQNIPASVVSVTVDEEPPYAIHVRGRVDEHTFKMSELVTWTSSACARSGEFALRDKLTNHADYENEYQIIYHGNFGAPSWRRARASARR